MLTQRTTSRLWVAGLVCLVATSASAQERTANYSGKSATPRGAIQPVAFHGMHQTPNNYYNPWANYAPGYNTYPTAYSDPNRGYTAYGHTGGSCWGHRGNCHHDGAECRANFGRRFRCSMAWLKPLTYWDVGSQTDIIAVNPGYTHPNDMNQGYAAQGYGGPVSVPQAPNIRSNYNYGWGLPSSRLTPTSMPNGY